MEAASRELSSLGTLFGVRSNGSGLSSQGGIRIDPEVQTGAGLGDPQQWGPTMADQTPPGVPKFREWEGWGTGRDNRIGKWRWGQLESPRDSTRGRPSWGCT